MLFIIFLGELLNTSVGVISMHSFCLFVSFLSSPEVFRSAYRHCFILHYEALNVLALILALFGTVATVALNLMDEYSRVSE